VNTEEKNQSHMKINITKIPVVIEEYKSDQYTNPELADRHGVSLSTILNWVRQSGVPRKRPGLRPQEKPSPTNRQIIELSSQFNGNEIARRFGVSRQRVHQVLDRWKHLRPERPRLVCPSIEKVRKEHREVRSEIVSFRLTSDQARSVRTALMTWGFGNRLSNSAACRAVLLAAIGCGRITLHGDTTIMPPKSPGNQQQGAGNVSPNGEQPHTPSSL
jgi:transposase-like protein